MTPEEKAKEIVNRCLGRSILYQCQAIAQAIRDAEKHAFESDLAELRGHIATAEKVFKASTMPREVSEEAEKEYFEARPHLKDGELHEAQKAFREAMRMNAMEKQTNITEVALMAHLQAAADIERRWPNDEELRVKVPEICAAVCETVTQQAAKERATRAFYEWLKARVLGGKIVIFNGIVPTREVENLEDRWPTDAWLKNEMIKKDFGSEWIEGALVAWSILKMRVLGGRK